MTNLQCNHKGGREGFDHTVIAMKPGLHTSHQKARGSPCSGDILGPKAENIEADVVGQKIMATDFCEGKGVILAEFQPKGQPSILSRTVKR
jgi:hypothetical protein